MLCFATAKINSFANIMLEILTGKKCRQKVFVYKKQALDGREMDREMDRLNAL